MEPALKVVETRDRLTGCALLILLVADSVWHSLHQAPKGKAVQNTGQPCPTQYTFWRRGIGRIPGADPSPPLNMLNF